MTGGNLTRDEAEERARLVSAEHYAVELDLTRGETTFGSRSTITFGCSEPGAATFVDLLAPAVRSVTLNGEALDPAEVFDGARVHLSGLRTQNVVVIDADAAYSRTGEGLHRFVDPVDGEVYLYTQFEPADSRRLFANFEQPDLKARFQLTVTALARWRVWSNETLEELSQGADGANTWRFNATEPISTYITAVVAGDYHVVEDEHTVRLPDGSDLLIPVSAMVRKSLAPYFDAAAILEVTKAGLDFYHRIFDYPYPFGKYDSAFVPEYNLGAMENPGLVTFNERMIFRSKTTDASYQNRAETIMHEMAHMWFGDLVTMKWWDDLWLKESFADFMGAYALTHATRWERAWVSFATGRKAWAYRQDQLPTTHPIVADIRDLEDARLNFDGITYAKGASVLKQLAAYVGEEAFLEGARRYFQRHAFGNTTLDDLLATLEETSGRDLKTWSKAWLETAGVNTLTVETETGADGVVTAAGIAQSAVPEFPTLRPHRIAVGCYSTNPATGAVELVERIELDVDGARTELPQLVGKPLPGLVLLNDLDLTYAKIRFTPAELDAFEAGGLAALPDAMARALAWSGVWHMTRDAAMSGRRFIAIVLRNIEAESDISVVQNLLRQLRLVRGEYLDPAHRPAADAEISTRFWDLLAAAASGSDHQVAFAYGAVRGATQDSDFAKLKELLSGELSFDGLTVDQDLRWAIIETLAAAGLDDDSVLADREAATDDTSDGRRHRAAARAARPLAEAKAEAWRLVVETPDQPNDLIGAVLAEFYQVGAHELAEPYVGPYFDGLAAVWAERSIQNAERLVSGGFPWPLASPELLARTDEWLASDAAKAPALRRLVLEARDDAARALRARECDRNA
ncbi:aminopeptidase N [Catenulispora acidiphila DSM 44928]|uniref:Aminopeptidase N n=1 Tax=Catenulispora acidiphila (strain DSM 44928 / JCM 14897 / NBRC 102108 / NRRL B-24433 / ID139908) TaxID=479433 RepID=C7QGW1_CATAD|nr:aminopeptidase N [Catenulispora acidiphila]ACU76811.1 aminopeptidase N [Catenulispora acidiphila DSM 44928]